MQASYKVEKIQRKKNHLDEEAILRRKKLNKQKRSKRLEFVEVI